MSKLKLRYTQPGLPIEIIEERLRFARLYVDLTRTFHEIAFPKNAKGFGSDLETLMVLICVFIGDAEGRPTTATKIASHAGMPRATVYRRLEQLIKINKVKRIARNYYLAPGGASPNDHGRISKLLNGYLMV